jgi:hypothetical protein
MSDLQHPCRPTTSALSRASSIHQITTPLHYRRFVFRRVLNHPIKAGSVSVALTPADNLLNQWHGPDDTGDGITARVKLGTMARNPRPIKRDGLVVNGDWMVCRQRY